MSGAGFGLRPDRRLPAPCRAVRAEAILRQPRWGCSKSSQDSAEVSRLGRSGARSRAGVGSGGEPLVLEARIRSIRVRVRVIESIEGELRWRLQLEVCSLLLVAHADGDLPGRLAPQQDDLDTAARPARELSVGAAWHQCRDLRHLWILEWAHDNSD